MVKNSEPKKMRRKMPTLVPTLNAKGVQRAGKGHGTVSTSQGLTCQSHEEISIDSYPYQGDEEVKLSKAPIFLPAKKNFEKNHSGYLWWLFVLLQVLLFFVRGSQLLRQFQKLPHLSAAFPFDIYRSRRLLLRPWRWGLVQPSTSTIQKSHETCCHSHVDV